MKIKVGKIIDAKGLQGKLKVFFLADDPQWALKLKNIYLGDKEVRILNIKPTNDPRKFELEIEGIKTRTEAENLKNTELFLLEEFFKSKKGENLYLREILGFKVLDKNIVFGKIIGFGSNGAQDLIEVEKMNQETVLVPLVKEFILNINMQEKTVYLDLPSGF